MSTHVFLVLGAAAVGKTSIIRRWESDEFADDVQTTMGIQPTSKTVDFNNTEYKLQIWDTSGDKGFANTIYPYIRGATVIIYVFALDDRLSFECIPAWARRVDETFVRHKYLVGNKSDKQRVILSSEIKEYVNTFGVVYYETSAKTGDNISSLFDTILLKLDADELTDFDEESEDDDSFQLISPRKQKRCCGFIK